MTQDVMISLPEPLYLRLQQVAQGTKQSLAEVIVRAVQVGSPPSWEEAPAEFQSDLAALDRLDDVMPRKAYAAELVRSRYSSGWLIN